MAGELQLSYCAPLSPWVYPCRLMGPHTQSPDSLSCTGYSSTLWCTASFHWWAFGCWHTVLNGVNHYLIPSPSLVFLWEQPEKFSAAEFPEFTSKVPWQTIRRGHIGPKHVFQSPWSHFLLVLSLDKGLCSFHSYDSNSSQNLWVLILYWLFVSLKWENPWQKQWKEWGRGARVYSSSQFDWIVHCGREDMEAGAWGSWCHCIQVRKQRMMNNNAKLTFSFSFSPDPSPWNDSSHIQGRSSHLNEPKLYHILRTVPGCMSSRRF